MFYRIITYDVGGTVRQKLECDPPGLFSRVELWTFKWRRGGVPIAVTEIEKYVRHLAQQDKSLTF